MKHTTFGLLIFLTNVFAWAELAEPCKLPTHDSCSNVGCVNAEISSCEAKQDMRRVTQSVPTGGMIEQCIRDLVQPLIVEIPVTSVIAAHVTCLASNAVLGGADKD